MLGVDNTFREASYGLGAGKLRTVFKIVLPSAMPGILSGIILAIGRIVGETAALIYTAGTVPEAATKLTSSSRTISVHLYCLLNEGLYTEQAYATAVFAASSTAFSLIVIGKSFSSISTLNAHLLVTDKYPSSPSTRLSVFIIFEIALVISK